MKRVLAVDRHPIVLEGIRAVLSAGGFEVLTATTPRQALMLASRSMGVAFVVTGVSVSAASDGIALLRELRLPAVIFAGTGAAWSVGEISALECVRGGVLKDDDAGELLSAVHAVADGLRYFSASFDRMRREASLAAGALSAKDVDILSRLSAGEVNRDIAAALHVSEKTIEYHRARILRRLSAATMPEAVRRAVALGVIHA